MLTEREEKVIAFVGREKVVERRGGDQWAEGWNAAMSFLETAIPRGDHLVRPEPTIPASEWTKTSNVGH